MSEDEKKHYGQGKNPNSLKNLKPLVKGQILNPEGARAHSPITKELRKFTNELFIDLLQLAIMGDRDGLKKLIADETTPAIQVGIAQSLLNAIEKGDWDIISKITERITGVAPKVVHLKTEQVKTDEMSEDELYNRAREIRAKNELIE